MKNNSHINVSQVEDVLRNFLLHTLTHLVFTVTLEGKYWHLNFVGYETGKPRGT